MEIMATVSKANDAVFERAPGWELVRELRELVLELSHQIIVLEHDKGDLKRALSFERAKDPYYEGAK